MKEYRKVQWSDGAWYVTCEEVLTFLLEYLSDELPPDRQLDFERHLEGCPSCRAYLATYRETMRLARGAERDPDLPAEEMPPELIRAILAARS
ncbi:MAG TPA: zf-HC2 domain-containing protein [Thermoanaerobaculia bacterium]|nr:zf-HC2 domain-containing protein [Thermoanaerobaculia bacterium]